VASEDESAADAAPDPPADPVACSACRGTGQVVSNLGGHPNLVECPWCDGGGVRLADHDAQARRRGESPGAAGDPGTSPGGSGERPPDGGGDQAA
jgi:hypothetical protein